MSSAGFNVNVHLNYVSRLLNNKQTVIDRICQRDYNSGKNIILINVYVNYFASYKPMLGKPLGKSEGIDEGITVGVVVGTKILL